MKSMINTLKRIKAQCERHYNCENCIFADETKKALTQSRSIVKVKCTITKAIEDCLLKDGALMPRNWNIDVLEKELNERSI